MKRGDVVHSEIYSEELLAFLDALKENGFGAEYIRSARRMIRKFEETYLDFSERNIKKFDFERANLYKTVSPALILKMYVEFCSETKPDLLKYRRSRGVKDPYTRPCNCPRLDCAYNAQPRCRYEPMKKLAELIVPKSCPYFITTAEQERKKKVARSVKGWDHLYGHRATYLDSHSAMWIE